tara:strand:+ start:83 stop:1123 length:1041 start_codon:yes stop_codon:yes gene_type:complete
MNDFFRVGGTASQRREKYWRLCNDCNTHIALRKRGRHALVLSTPPPLPGHQSAKRNLADEFIGAESTAATASADAGVGGVTPMDERENRENQNTQRIETEQNQNGEKQDRQQTETGKEQNGDGSAMEVEEESAAIPNSQDEKSDLGPSKIGNGDEETIIDGNVANMNKGLVEESDVDKEENQKEKREGEGEGEEAHNKSPEDINESKGESAADENKKESRKQKDDVETEAAARKEKEEEGNQKVGDTNVIMNEKEEEDRGKDVLMEEASSGEETADDLTDGKEREGMKCEGEEGDDDHDDNAIDDAGDADDAEEKRTAEEEGNEPGKEAKTAEESTKGDFLIISIF